MHTFAVGWRFSGSSKCYTSLAVTSDFELRQISDRMQLNPSCVGLMHHKHTFLLVNNPTDAIKSQAARSS